MCSKNTISQCFFVVFSLFLACASKWSMLGITRHCATHLQKNIPERQRSTHSLMKANLSTLTMAVLQPSYY